MHVAGFTLTRRLASGACGTVFSASPDPTSSPPPVTTSAVAIKLVPGARVTTAVAREVAHLASLTHPCILALHHVAHVPAPGSAPAALALVTELLSAGDLFDAVERRVGRGGLPHAFVRAVLRDVARGLVYLKGRRIVHADIKLENVGVVVGEDEVERAWEATVAKLIDFGTSRGIDDDGVCGKTIGTALYLAPELLSGARPGYASDAWALGVMLYSMLCGWYPFEAEAEAEAEDDTCLAGTSLASTEAIAFEADYAREAILTQDPRPLPEDVPEDLAAIVGMLLTKDVARRGSAEDVLVELRRSEDEALCNRRFSSLPHTTSAISLYSGSSNESSSGAVSAPLNVPVVDDDGEAIVDLRRLRASERFFETASEASSERDDVSVLDEEEECVDCGRRRGYGREELEHHLAEDDHFKTPERRQTPEQMLDVVREVQAEVRNGGGCC